MLVIFIVCHTAAGQTKPTVFRERNFYGCLRVDKDDPKTSFGDTLTLFRLFHGETQHGMQFQERFLRNKPTTYYGPKGGGLALCSHTNYVSGTPMRVGAIGLGAGTLAVYGRTNDLYRFYEINPQMIAVAQNTNYFSFVSDSAAKVEIVLGDARKRLEQEKSRGEPKYDVLIVDAYTGDAIPFHLATREAFQLYLDRLNTDGILAVHISNWHIDLTPLCKAVATTFDLNATGYISPSTSITSCAQWVCLSRKPMTLNTDGTREINWNCVRHFDLPTDEKGSLISLISFGYQIPLKEINIDLKSL